MVMCNFLAAGPTVAIVETTIDFFGPPGPNFTKDISKIAYFYTTTGTDAARIHLFQISSTDSTQR